VETEVSEEELIGVRKLLGGAEPNVPAEFQGEVCTRYLKSYIFPGSDNNSQEYLRPGDVSLEAVRVQDFLNLINAPTGGYPNNGLPLATTFTQETKQAVIDYQNRYRATVLDPWGLSQGTGWWYQTTRSSANALVGTPEPEIQLDNGKSHTAF